MAFLNHMEGNLPCETVFDWSYIMAVDHFITPVRHKQTISVSDDNKRKDGNRQMHVASQYDRNVVH